LIEAENGPGQQKKPRLSPAGPVEDIVENSAHEVVHGPAKAGRIHFVNDA
jgi:hypothetical protein